jgi:phosphoribosylaminoimidazole (AIR) synthetase
MGIGLIIIVPPEQKESIIQELENLGEIPYFIGKVSAGDSTDNRVNII